MLYRGGSGRGRSEPYPSRRDGYNEGPRRYDPVPPSGPRGGAQQREEYASDQVKDLLELYIRDPTAFDQYARSYYYGERAERRPMPSSGGGAYYDGRSAPDR
jgi:hypothetical protein